MFYLPARMKLLAVKRTPPVLSPLPLKENPSLSYVVKSTHDVLPLPPFQKEYQFVVSGE